MEQSITRRHAIAAALACATSPQVFGRGAAYPSKTVKIVLPVPPGAAIDAAMRMVAERLAKKWGQSVVVENRPGASTIIATSAVVQSAPDGYTLLGGTNLLVQNEALGRKLPYDLTRDLQPIAQVLRAQAVVLARADLPVDSLQDLFMLARRRPGALSFASWGVASTAHIVYEKMRLDQRIEFTHVAYKGSTEIVTALLTGEVQVGMGELFSSGPHIRSGKMKVIGVAGPKRLRGFPNVPTLAEAGVLGFDVFSWSGLFGPANMDPAVVQQIGLAVNEVLGEREVVERFAKDLVLEAAPASPSVFAQTIERDLAIWRAIVRLTKVTLGS
jgi:tripartite-type tricarboxylate transporter receptor subunit TctC